MEYSQEKTALLMNVANCIKELQKQSTATDDTQRRGNTIRNGRSILSFCGAIELVLRHGLASSWRNAFSNSPSFWAVAKAISRKDAINDLKGLSHCVNDHARARAWIRLAINEQSLESYTSVLINDGDTLGIYYEPHAFLRDREQTSALLGLLAGMSFTMDMDITVNDPSLEFEPTPAAAMNRDKERMAESQRTGSFSEKHSGPATEAFGRSKGPGALASGAVQGASGDGRDSVDDFQSATLSSALQDTQKAASSKPKKKKKKRKSTHTKERTAETTSSAGQDGTPTTAHTPARATPVDLESSPDATVGPDTTRGVAANSGVASLDPTVDSTPADVAGAPVDVPLRLEPCVSETGTAGGTLDDSTEGSGAVNDVDDNSRSNPADFFNNTADNLSENTFGDEPGAVTAIDNERGAALEIHPESGTNNTKSGTNNTKSGTDIGTRPETSADRNAEDTVSQGILLGDSAVDDESRSLRQSDTHTADAAVVTGDSNATNVPAEHPGPTSTGAETPDVGTDRSHVAVPCGSESLDAVAVLPDTPVAVTASAGKPSIAEAGLVPTTRGCARDEHGATPTHTPVPDGRTGEVLDAVHGPADHNHDDREPIAAAVVPPLALFSDADDAFEDALGYGSPPRHTLAAQVPGPDRTGTNSDAGVARGGQVRWDGGEMSAVQDAPAVGDDMMEQLRQRRLALGLHSVPSAATSQSPTLERSPSDARGPRTPSRTASATAGGSDGGWQSPQTQGSRSSELSQEQQELLNRINNVYTSVQMISEDTLEEAEQAAAAAIAKSSHLSSAAWDNGPMSDVECRRLVQECAVHGCFALRIDDVTVPEDAYTDAKTDPRHADWALYVNDRNTVHKFPIENVGPECFQWDDKSYDSLERLVADLVHGNARLLSPQTGRPLRMTSPAHDPTAWSETTSFSAEGPGPAHPSVADAMAAVSDRQDTGSTHGDHDTTPTATNPGSESKPEDIVSILDNTPTDDLNLAPPLEPRKDEQKSPTLTPAAVPVETTPESSVLAEATESFHDAAFQDSDGRTGSARLDSPGLSPLASRRVSTNAEDFVLVDDYFRTEMKKQEAQEDDNVDVLQKQIDTAMRIIQEGPPEAMDVQCALADLVVLRLRREKARDRLALSVVDDADAVEIIVPHKLHKLAAREPANPPETCDCCQKPIKQNLLGILDKDPLPRALRCVDCKITLHYKCMDLIVRQCVGAEALRGIATKICPEDGLSTQQYKCVDCKVQIGFQGMFAEARLCDYFGKYLCPDCHHGDTAVIPARVVHNWDFSPRAVSRRAKETLAVLHTRPVMDLNEVNPSLQNHVEEVLELQRARTSLAHIRKFLLTCRKASGQPDLLGVLDNRPYLMTTAGMVSMKDLLEVRSGELIRELTAARERCVQHITVDCQRCQGAGSYCELCQSDAVIYPFTPQVTECDKCKSVFHSSCWGEAPKCPKCVRIELYALRSERRMLPEYQIGGIPGDEHANDATDHD
eukprot:m.269465 g.269465  ORF g.269465 m.269465 type:complete len:1480 (+) comp19734_c0_seq69:342-4781(+)